ncbi:MAG TPA: TraR/DksA C4-type zinc finger protein [Gammaproteobacteria bacterium]
MQTNPILPSHLGRFKAQLQERRIALRQEIASELSAPEREEYAALADQVLDSGDASLADVLADVHIADVQRDVDEVRDIEAALKRIEQGSYGICVDCGRPIESRRLEVQPTATRCLEDQDKYERAHGRPPSL